MVKIRIDRVTKNAGEYVVKCDKGHRAEGRTIGVISIDNWSGDIYYNGDAYESIELGLNDIEYISDFMKRLERNFKSGRGLL